MVALLKIHTYVFCCVHAGMLHRRCISRKFVVVRLHSDDAALSPAVQAPSHPSFARGGRSRENRVLLLRFQSTSLTIFWETVGFLCVFFRLCCLNTMGGFSDGKFRLLFPRKTKFGLLSLSKTSYSSRSRYPTLINYKMHAGAFHVAIIH